jgi:sugar-specific transcriptional regulator TrmB
MNRDNDDDAESGNDRSLVGILGDFGLTRQESGVYLTLLAEGSMNGYEIAKATGISRSNAYTSLASLVDKGAAWIIEGSPTRYTAVSAGEFCDNRIHALSGARERLLAGLPSRREESGGYLTIYGSAHILDQLRHLILETDERLYLALNSSLLGDYMQELSAIATAGKKLVIITERAAVESGTLVRELPGATVHAGDVGPSQVRAIADSRYVLTGDLSGGASASCLFSDEPNLVELFKSALKNEIRLAEIDRSRSKEE